MTVMDEVLAELERARKLHPEPHHSAHESYAILLEEMDELWKLVMWNPKDDEGKRRRNVEMREEAIQIAATAIRFVQDVCDR